MGGWRIPEQNRLGSGGGVKTTPTPRAFVFSSGVGQKRNGRMIGCCAITLASPSGRGIGPWIRIKGGRNEPKAPRSAGPIEMKRGCHGCFPLFALEFHFHHAPGFHPDGIPAVGPERLGLGTPPIIGVHCEEGVCVRLSSPLRHHSPSPEMGCPLSSTSWLFIPPTTRFEHARNCFKSVWDGSGLR